MIFIQYPLILFHFYQHFYTLTFIFKFDKNITDSMTKYTESIKSYNTRVNSLGDDIKKITSKVILSVI